MSDTNKATMTRWTEEVWNAGNLATLRQIAAEDCSFRTNQIEPAKGIDGIAEVVKGLRAGFPDGKFTVEETLADGNSVAQRWTFRGTQKGEWMGQPATGKGVSVTGTGISHFKDGKIVEHLTDWDALGMMQQLGVVDK